MRPLRLILAATLAAAAMWAQLATSSIVGTVTDPGELAMAGVAIKAIHNETGQARSSVSNEHGDFVLNSLDPGSYTVSFTAAGFKTKQLQEVAVVTGETLPVGQVKLELGGVTETVQVTTQGAPVMTRSSERAAEITSTEIEDLEVRGRNFMDLLELLPGVVSTSKSQDISTNPSIYVAGNRNTSNNVTIDGTPSNDMGNGFQMKMQVSKDAVGEVKVLTSNYQAEFGRLAGSNVVVVTKSGSKAFHGSASYFTRNEDFNANNFFNNLNSLPRPRYRYNTATYTISGPLTIPHHFNRNRDKLFFFWGQEFWPSTLSTLGTVTVPNALERQGDFSQSLSQAGTLTIVRDPANNNAPFAGNQIPKNRLDANGIVLLNIFPQPNFTNRAISGGNYNFVFSAPRTAPLTTKTGKIDYILNANNTITGNLNMYTNEQKGTLGLPDSAGNWPLYTKTYSSRSKSTSDRWTRIIRPALINDFSFGFFAQPADDFYTDEEFQKISRGVLGFNAPQFSPATNDLNVIPNATFGGVPNAANLALEARFPLFNRYYIIHWADNLTYIRGAHTIKAGVYVERFTRNQKKTGTVFNGAFDFQNNANNPFNTGYAYSNAALGNFYTYTQTTSRKWMNIRDWDEEAFIQDNWKVSRRLTVDLGLRLYWIPPMTERDDLISGFVPSTYDPAKAARLIQPALSGGQRVGIDPNNGTIYSATLIGAIAPSAGSSAAGMVTATNPGSLPRSLVNNRGVQWGPRFGFAYDLFGNGKTAVRGGFGMFYNRPTTEGYFSNFVGQPPNAYAPTLTWGQMSGLASATGLISPGNVFAPDIPGKIATVMNYSFSIQRDIGFKTVVDIGYQGTLARHLQWETDLNAIPIGANFQASNLDPTTGRVLPNGFLRPINIYGSILVASFGSSSNYNSLQVSARRRLSRNIQFGAAWTWSKALDYNDADTDQIVTLVRPRSYYYGMASFDRTHTFSLSYIYDLPRSPWKNRIVVGFLDRWQISGITQFQSGQPLGISMTVSNGQDITGTASLAPRPDVTGNPVLPKGDRTFARNFDTSVLKLPEAGTLGNSAPVIIRGPGLNNWDVSLIKNVAIHERLRLQFRASAFNTFNHIQFSAINTSATFNPSGQQTNAKLGTFTTARDPRQLQLGMRLVF